MKRDETSLFKHRKSDGHESSESRCGGAKEKVTSTCMKTKLLAFEAEMKSKGLD